MSEARRIGTKELRELVSDGDELLKGTWLLDSGALFNFARYENKLFCESRGTSPIPYRVSVILPEEKNAARTRCSCMAARSRPVCKHAAGLLVAWSNAPESFAVSDRAPEGDSGEKKKKSVKRGKTSAAALGKAGIEAVETLIRELAVTGVASVSPARVDQIRGLGQNLREQKLRRLSSRTLALADQLESSIDEPASLDPLRYTSAVADMLLLARRLRKHFAGDALEDRYVEELLGKTWRKADRTPVEGLSLIEYAFFHVETSDDFVVRESRFFETTTNQHYTERQIIPAFLAKRTEPKKSYYGRVLEGAKGSVYPGFAPHRLEVSTTGTPRTIDHDALSAMVAGAVTDVGAALETFRETRRDVFAPDQMPLLVRAEFILAIGQRTQVVDDRDRALFLAADREVEERLQAALHDTKLVALVGDVTLAAALPTLLPHAAIVDAGDRLELRSLQGASTFAGTRKVRAKKKRIHDSVLAIRAAREAGASQAAVSLAEIRDELANTFLLGLGSLDTRRAEPMAARLTSLTLEKVAGVLMELAAKKEPSERLEGCIKVFVALEGALIRLIGAAHTDRATLEQVPQYQSVHVRRINEILTPLEVQRARREGRVNRWESAIHHARFFETLPPEELAKHVYPAWSDGGAAPFIAQALATQGEVATSLALEVLAGSGRTTRLTALKVLKAAGGSVAHAKLTAIAKKDHDEVLRSHAAMLLPPEQLRVSRVHELGAVLLVAGRAEDRVGAAQELAKSCDPAAVPALRLSFSGDISAEVRKAAALALARMLDPDMVETFVEMLEARDESQVNAKLAIDALTEIGDVRALEPLLAAFREGFKAPAATKAIIAMGSSVLNPLLETLTSTPEDQKLARAIKRALKEKDGA